MNQPNKTRPSNVPEENVYNNMHWTIVVAFICIVAAIYVFVNANS